VCGTVCEFVSAGSVSDLLMREKERMGICLDEECKCDVDVLKQNIWDGVDGVHEDFEHGEQT